MNVHIFDFLITFGLTIPMFALYIVFAIRYFLVIDKKQSTTGVNEHGLSRFILMGVFFIFGLLLFDLAMEFISTHALVFVEEGKINEATFKKMASSVIFISFSKFYKYFPISILTIGTLFCTSLYIGAEGLIASFKTLHVPKGMTIELPAIKRKRLSTIFMIWCYVAVVSTVFTCLSGYAEANFDTKNIYTALVLTLSFLVIAERSPTALSNFTLSDGEKSPGKPEEATVDLTDMPTPKDALDTIDKISDSAVSAIEKMHDLFKDEETRDKEDPFIHGPNHHNNAPPPHHDHPHLGGGL